MGGFNPIFSKQKDMVVIEEAEQEELTYMQEAESASQIVTEGVEKGDFLDMSDHLENLSSHNASRECYVFEAHNFSTTVIMTIIGAIITIGYLYFLIIGLGIYIYSAEYRLSGLIEIIGAIAIIGINAALASRTMGELKFNQRYEKYMGFLRFKNIFIVDDLVTYSDYNLKIVSQDLKKAIKNKLIPQGHFTCNDIVFMLSDDIYAKYKENQAAYDRYYRKQLEERMRMRERTPDIQQLMEVGQSYVTRIRESNDIIQDRGISSKLEKMEKIVAMIFHEVDVNPRQAENLGMFLNYYLPTTDKLLQAYIGIDEKEIKGVNLTKAKREIERSVDIINRSFEEILNQFFEAEEMDITSDVSAMKSLMEQEGLID